MTFEEATEKAKELNDIGIHREGWFYYAAYYDGKRPEFQGKFFVMRRPKKTPVHVAIYATGEISIRERSA